MVESAEQSGGMAESGEKISDSELARLTLRAVCLDENAPAAARAQAASKLAEVSGLTGKFAEHPVSDTGRDLSSLTVSELDREIARLSGVRGGVTKS